MYQLRIKYPKSDPMNYIAKLLLNSLYGRFGMSDEFDDFVVASQDSLAKLAKNKKIIIKDIINLDEDFIVKLKNEDEITSLVDNLSGTQNINIAIASFVTSYARIHMSQFKNNKDIKLYYTDTDSAVFDKPLSSNFVDSKKLEIIILN